MNARVLTFDGGEEEAYEADILIRDGVIEALGSGLAHSAPANAECLDASGLIAIPGLINAHIHSPGNLLRGALDGLPLEIFMLYEVPPLAEEGNEDLTYLRTTLGAIEMLKIGITSVIDDVSFPEPRPLQSMPS